MGSLHPRYMTLDMEQGFVRAKQTLSIKLCLHRALNPTSTSKHLTPPEEPKL